MINIYFILLKFIIKNDLNIFFNVIYAVSLILLSNDVAYSIISLSLITWHVNKLKSYIIIYYLKKFNYYILLTNNIKKENVTSSWQDRGVVL